MPNPFEIPHIAIVGGGITGLSAAWHLRQSGVPVRISLFESGPSWGGKVVTDRVTALNGGKFIIDSGPESFITRKPELWDLVHELGLQDEIVDPGSETRDMYVLDGGVPIAVPLSPTAFIRSPLISSAGKLRLLAEPFIPPRLDGQDESLAEFADRRLGEEARRKFIGPILAGIYNTDPETQSILTTSPVMREMEAEHGGLFKAVIGRMLAGRKARQNGASEPKKPRFFTFSTGAARVIDKLVAALESGGAAMHLNAAVIEIIHEGSGYWLPGHHDRGVPFDAVILAAPANVAASLLVTSAPNVSANLSAIRHTHIGTISFMYQEDDLPSDLALNGLMVPRREQRAIDAVTFTSRKMPSRAPHGFALLRVFYGGSRPAVAEMDEDELVETVRAELKDILSIHAEPTDYVTHRWLNSFPQADVGHLDRVARIESALPDGLYLAGSSYRGIGVPDCVRQGRDAAVKAIAKIKAAERLQNNISL